MENAYSFLNEELNLSYGDSVVVAVSGGPDSMALLHLLKRLSKSIDLQIVCAHVNHNVRKESIKESLFVRKYCAAENIIFEELIINEYEDDNFQNFARKKRYEYFEKILKKYNSKFLLTAHHADDLLETILMRIVRGSTLRGIAGFSELKKMPNYLLIRPLIHVTKQEIIDYNKNYNVKYVVDKSNNSDKYTRNRFRKYIVPALKKEDNEVHKKFYQFSKMLIEYDDYINKEVKKEIKKVYYQNALNLEIYKKYDKLIQKRMINYILEELYKNDLINITSKHINLILNLIKSRKHKLQIHLPSNIVVNKEQGFVYFEVMKEPVYNYNYKLEDYLNLPNGKNISIISESNSDSNDVCRLNLKEIKLPLYVRTRKNGDKMSIKGMLGRKKINDIFTDEKIKTSDRELWPIVLDAAGNIVWLPGLKKSTFAKTKDEKYDIILKYY